jgi:hypothetical protein
MDCLNAFFIYKDVFLFTTKNVYFSFFRNPKLSKNLKIHRPGPFNAGDIAKVQIFHEISTLGSKFYLLSLFSDTDTLYV